MKAWRLLALFVVALASCKTPGAFVCASDEECTPAGLGGACESNGFCSFPDEGCDSGRRYASHAGGGLSGACVGDGDLPDGRPDSDEPIGTIDAASDGTPADARPPDGPPGDAPEGGCIVEGSGCLALPTARVEKGNTTNPANYGCPPETIQTSAIDIDMSGTINDASGAGPRAGAGVSAFRDLMVSIALANDTANLDGVYDMTFPSGTPDFVHWKITHGGAVDSYYLNEVQNVTNPTQTKNFLSYSDARLDSLAGGGGLTRTDARTVYLGDIYDCDGNGVKNAIGLISSTSGAGNVLPTLVPGTTVLYLDGAGLTTPRSMRTQSNRTGQFYLFEVPQPSGGQRFFLQAWGFLTAADVARGAAGLVLLSEFEVPVPAASYLRVGMRSTQGPLP
jgi:hypothetical protein